MTTRTPIQSAALDAWIEISDADSTIVHAVPHADRDQIFQMDRVCGQLLSAMRVLETLMHEDDRPE